MKHTLKTDAARCAAAALVLTLLCGCSAPGGTDGLTPSAPLTETPGGATVTSLVTETPGPVVYENAEY